jgi:general secretion pathway protein G
MKTESNHWRENALGGRLRRVRSGTTLVRILVLLGVVALVVGVAVTNLNGNLCDDDPKIPAEIFVTQSIDTPLLAYKHDTGSYPTTVQGLQALLVAPPGVTGWKGPYLNTNAVPLDPWKQPYHYAYPSTHGQPTGKYDCWSIGPSSFFHGHDNIGNWVNLP